MYAMTLLWFHSNIPMTYLLCPESINVSLGKYCSSIESNTDYRYIVIMLISVVNYHDNNGLHVFKNIDYCMVIQMVCLEKYGDIIFQFSSKVSIIVVS